MPPRSRAPSPRGRVLASGHRAPLRDVRRRTRDGRKAERSRGRRRRVGSGSVHHLVAVIAVARRRHKLGPRSAPESEGVRVVLVVVDGDRLRAPPLGAATSDAGTSRQLAPARRTSSSPSAAHSRDRLEAQLPLSRTHPWASAARRTTHPSRSQSPTGHEQRPTKLRGQGPAVTSLSDRRPARPGGLGLPEPAAAGRPAAVARGQACARARAHESSTTCTTARRR